MSFSHAGLLSVSDVSRECQIGRKTVDGYLQVLEDLLLAFRLHSFSRRARRQVVQHPKFYLVDTGLFQALRPRGPLDSGAPALPDFLGGEFPRLTSLAMSYRMALIGD